ncbi:TPA: hypothetical protein RWT92_001234 [Legionella pneumophila]|nr:hypothetical protein [Legionella pneumophila]
MLDWASHNFLITAGIILSIGLVLIVLAKGSSIHRMKLIANIGFYLAFVALVVFVIVLFLDVLPRKP